jgi:hypothetical protein
MTNGSGKPSIRHLSFVISSTRYSRLIKISFGHFSESKCPNDFFVLLFIFLFIAACIAAYFPYRSRFLALEATPSSISSIVVTLNCVALPIPR